MDIYVGNLPYTATEETLSGLFSSFGPIKKATIIMDRETGRSKGFGFVTLADDSQVSGAIEAINGSEMEGRTLKANASEPRPRFKPSGGTGGGGGGGATGGGGGGYSGGGGGGYSGGGGGGGGYSGGGGGGRSKGSQKGKRKQKGGYDEGW